MELLGPYAPLVTCTNFVVANTPTVVRKVVKAAVVTPVHRLLGVTMFDSVEVDQLPAGAAAVAGYVNGRYDNFSKLAPLFPHAHRVSIDVNASSDADVLDIENGDATNADAPAWFHRQAARGIKPGFYTSVSNAQALIDYLASKGIARSQYKLWSAHYTYKAHRCSSVCGFGFKGSADGTQYSDKAPGRNIDTSLCSPSFFPPAV